MSNDTDNVMKEMLIKSGQGIVVELSRLYGFDSEEGMKHLNLEGIRVEVSKVKESPGQRSSKSQSRIPLPFIGVKCSGNCEAIR